MKGDRGAGYIRLDWFTPDGLDSWGDGRLTILGTDGYIEVRKNIDIAGPKGGDHLYLVDNKKTQFIDCKDMPLPFGELFVDDVINRTETAMTQEHCFLATELALKAQQAQKNKFFKVNLSGRYIRGFLIIFFPTVLKLATFIRAFYLVVK